MKKHGSTLQGAVRWALPLQVGWAILSALWNLVGVLLLSQGLSSPGPTASWIAAVVLMALAVTLIWTVRKLPLVYLLLSLLMGVGAFLSVRVAFTADPSLWPSPFWRWAGAALNGLGTLGAVAAAVGFFKWRTVR